MKRLEWVYREVLFNAMERHKHSLTQAQLAKLLGISLSTVNLALKPLQRMNAVKIKRRGFDIVDARKILLYWASIRNLQKDILFKTRVQEPVSQIEKEMPGGVVYTAYSAYKFRFEDVPADYSEVYVYGDKSLSTRFPENNRSPNLFVLEKDPQIERYGPIAPLAQVFVDLWNLKEWYAKDFLTAMEDKIERLLE